LRQSVRDRLRSAIQRGRFWEELLDGPAADLAITGHMEGAAAAADGLLERIDRYPSSGGEEHVLHIGSADPDLLTVRAARLIRMAGVVVHDPAIDGAVLDLARRDALKIAVQHNGGRWDRRLNQDCAGRGLMIVRLRASA
jgi:uroporphyrin-III C-methyltransferase/precorrin-2 dehydrogenase/sirohydrochlorin ferrochelatase